MIDPFDPVLLLLILSLALGIMLIFSFIDHFSVVRKLQDRIHYLENASGDDCYSCQDCGSKVKSEILGNSLLFYCPECSPIQYCEKTGRPYKDKCDCVQCVH